MQEVEHFEHNYKRILLSDAKFGKSMSANKIHRWWAKGYRKQRRTLGYG